MLICSGDALSLRFKAEIIGELQHLPIISLVPGNQDVTQAVTALTTEQSSQAIYF